MLDACLKFLNIWGGIWIRVNIDNYVPYQRILNSLSKYPHAYLVNRSKFKTVRSSKKEKGFEFQ